jgi:predicted MFS family arabinose efflux permease
MPVLSPLRYPASMSSPVTPDSAAALDVQRGDAQRNIRVLVAAQALGGASPAIIVSLGGLVGQMLASNPALATLPVSIYNLGLALGTIPAALLMQRAGRRTAYLLGAALGLVAGLVSAFGIMSSAFTMFCVGTFIAGFYGSCVQSYRFAAADAALPDDRARAISRVMIGGLAAAIIGPQMVIWTRDAMPAAPFAGSFFGQALLALLALPLLMRLKAPPPVVVKKGDSGRPLSEILRNPRFLVALMAGVVTYGLMSFVMTASPMAMVGCGHSVGEAALGIQWHVLAMFAPSFFTGRLIARFGKGTMTALGLLLIAASGAVALSGLELRVHRRHGHGDRLLSARRTRQGAGAQRFLGVRHGGDCVVFVGPPAERVGLGYGELDDVPDRGRGAGVDGLGTSASSQPAGRGRLTGTGGRPTAVRVHGLCNGHRLPESTGSPSRHVAWPMPAAGGARGRKRP